MTEGKFLYKDRLIARLGIGLKWLKMRWINGNIEPRILSALFCIVMFVMSTSVGMCVMHEVHLLVLMMSSWFSMGWNVFN